MRRSSTGRFFVAASLASLLALLFVMAPTPQSASSTAPVQSSCVAPASGLVSWWPGDGNANDIDGGNSGTLQNGATFAPGIAGQAFSLDGVDDFVNISGRPTLEVTSQFTLEAWIRPTDFSDNHQIISKFGSPGNWAYQIGVAPANAGSLRSDVSGNGNTYDTLFAPPSLLTVGQWAHVATTFNAGLWKLYINGVEVASKTSSVTSIFSAGSTNLSIGRDPVGYQYFPGLIDEPTLYSRALAPSEIQSIYNAGSAGKCQPLQLLVCSYNTNSVLRYRGSTGAFIDSFVPAGSGGLVAPGGLTFGPDGNLYASSNDPNNQILRFNGQTGAFIDAFVPSGTGGLNGPTYLIFGPDGNLYVSNFSGHNVLRFNGTTGAFIDVFASGGSPANPQGLAFGPDGNLYLADEVRVLEYNGMTGAFMKVFVPAGSGGLNEPVGLTFGTDGNLYVVSSAPPRSIMRYDGATGAFIDVFVPAGGTELDRPHGVIFGPDGNLYVSDEASKVLRYNGTTGAFIDAFVPAGSGGLNTATALIFSAPSQPQTLSSLSVNPTTVPGGQTLIGAVTLQNPAQPGGATINLATSDAGVATVPTNIIIAEGGTSGTFTVNTSAVTIDSTVYISASYQGASRSASLTVTAPRPDLQVASINAPNQAFTDSSFDLSWADSNTGQIRANSPWSDKLYLSTDNQLGSDTLLADFPFSQSLDPNQSATRTQVISIPRSAVPTDGQYFLIVLTDANNNVDEGSNENNNFRAVPITLNRTTRPDLVVQSIQAPDTAFFGQTINVRWTVKNVGGGSTDASEWSDRVYLSSDHTPGNAAVQLDVLNVSYLNAGESYVASADVKIPRGLFNTFHIVVTTDIGGAVAEDNETNNILNRPINLQVPPLPDLQVTLVQGPSQAFPGEPMLVNYRVENQGNGDTPQSESSWSDSIYLSPTQAFNPGTARLLGSQPHTGGLTQNAGYTVSNLSVSVPRDIIGDWYVFVWTDSSNSAYEFVNENNNTNFDQTHTVHIQATPPDLIVPSIESPGTANAGRQITINWTVKNQGAFDAAPNWFDTVYLATSATPNPATDTPLATVFHASTLGPGLTYSASANVTVPNCLNGTFYVYVFTDSRNQIFEFDPNFNAEQNSFSSPQPIQVTPIPPDLKVTSVSNPANGDAGQSISVSWTVTNQGLGPTVENTWVDSVYFGTSSTFNSSNALLVGSFTHTGDLAQTGSYTRTESVNIPTTAESTYYVFVSTDNSNAVQECIGEGNNITAGSVALNVVNVVSPPPDLQITVVNGPNDAFEGQTIAVQWAGKNAGNGPVLNSSWNDAVYFSSDPTLDANDTRLAVTLVSGPLPAGATYSAQAQVTIPQVSAGTYYLIAKADDSNFVSEGQHEDNNTGFTALSILIPGIDLQVTTVNAPTDAISGQDMTVSWAVTNNGTLQTFTSQWTDYVFLSRDQILDPTDRAIGFAQHSGALDGGGSYNTTFNAVVPARPYRAILCLRRHRQSQRRS